MFRFRFLEIKRKFACCNRLLFSELIVVLVCFSGSSFVATTTDTSICSAAVGRVCASTSHLTASSSAAPRPSSTDGHAACISGWRVLPARRQAQWTSTAATSTHGSAIAATAQSAASKYQGIRAGDAGPSWSHQTTDGDGGHSTRQKGPAASG